MNVKNSINSTSIKALLDQHAAAYNRSGELSYERPDPLLVARRHRDEYAALVCALFGYGRADAIVAFLDTIDFSLLDADDKDIANALRSHYYRFQNNADVIAFFCALARMRKEKSMQACFLDAYREDESVTAGIYGLMAALEGYTGRNSRGMRFLIGKPSVKTRGASPLKRWMMFLRWMVRSDALDMGLWDGVAPSRLIMPLDTHTFTVSQKLGLLKRKQYDLQAALELTASLRTFDPDDPVKYDFALYRIGQMGPLGVDALS